MCHDLSHLIIIDMYLYDSNKIYINYLLDFDGVPTSAGQKSENYYNNTMIHIISTNDQQQAITIINHQHYPSKNMQETKGEATPMPQWLR